ncbi:MAG: glucosaminidase domain-containing protein [bacterium]
MSYTTWGEIASWARKAGSKYPSLTAAQWALESNWGSAVSGKNNFFGIKGEGTKVKTTEFINGKEVKITDEFMDFDHPYECVQYLVDRWYKDFQSYKGVNNASSIEEAAKMLQSEGYATDPLYSKKLIDVIRRNSAIEIQNKKEMTTSIELKAAARWYSRLPHQDAAWDELQKSLSPEQLSNFASKYRASGTTNPPEGTKVFLEVPYYYQRDSKTGHGERSCQSSAIAMAVEYINPSLITDDDDYLKIVFRYGDTVAQAAHCKALDSLGIKYKFTTNGAESDLIRILKLGYPVPIGILHKGSIQNPSGGGHWITVIGYDDKCFYVHDPFGELDLVNGGYPVAGPTDGRSQRYSKTNLLKRWLINGKNDGWFWDLSGNSIVGK